ncbi:hypothetical protein [Aerosakkonema funiforme]|uniref:Uncharacterized protein n=2 Tax=Oscillatoriophycideae TaxID=1301283 RepID=A0A926ZMM5_9CYAN|nr:hypothetical protein [Aerosakkonema funiforme]MBD2186201.1 hypothetical protein [Aerosakkonema funiforme FACHB-1375]
MSNTTGTVKFIQFHQPPLESGEYQIKIEQTIKSNDKIPSQTFTRELTFAVTGERFGPLSPEDIYAVFPPSDSLGEHSNVLPHITVKRSTLPWERYPGENDQNLPWLVLLLFRETDFEHEFDRPKPKSITLQQLIAGEANIKFPNITLEVGQKGTEQVTVIDVKKKYLKDILPTNADLAYLAHVRKLEDATRNFSGDEFATIICNRLPEPNGISTVHLVSIEGRYIDADNFDYMGAVDEDLIRFVSLANWSFACVDPEQSFSQLVQKLNRNPSFPRLPQTENQEAEKFLAMGYIPLPHSLRQGSQTISWYRSPLIPGMNEETYNFPVKASDELLRYDSTLGLFDTSYAAAWQLGRMLTLQNQGLAIELFNWKRENAQNLKQLEDNVINNLPLRSRQIRPAQSIPEKIEKWFKGLELLQGIPFNYLVPDEGLLPIESIRFFWVDSLWVDCLQDGAFSIGRVTENSVEEDRKIRSTRRGFTRGIEQKITGIIMRSQVVSGWPNLLIDGYDKAVANVDSIDQTQVNLLSLLRMEKLAKDVLICLFEGEVKTVDIHLQPEGMHFGLDAPTKQSPEWSKNLRNINGEATDILISPIPWNNEQKEVINLEGLATKIQEKLPDIGEFTSGQFALQMIEGVQKVRFVINE